MNEAQQYSHAVKMAANARVLASMSDNKEVMRLADEAKTLATQMAEALGADLRMFNAAAIDEYMFMIHGKANAK